MAAKGKNDDTGADPTGGNINQIRDILVGPYQREQEAKLAHLEKLIERYRTESDNATARAQEKLEKRIATTSEKLAAKVTDLTKTLKESNKGQDKALDALGSEISDKIDELQAKMASDMKDLEKLTEEHVRTLRADFDAGIAELRDAKVGREDLGDYLMEIGLRLKGESSLKSIESSLKGGKGGAAYS